MTNEHHYKLRSAHCIRFKKRTNQWKLSYLNKQADKGIVLHLGEIKYYKNVQMETSVIYYHWKFVGTRIMAAAGTTLIIDQKTYSMNSPQWAFPNKNEMQIQSQLEVLSQQSEINS